MSLILNIDTSVETASVCLAKDGKEIVFAENNSRKDHSSWLHKGIQKMIKDENFHFSDLQAVAVSIGPGSYTGLRIGLSAAKGLCFGLKIPLITINTLEMMAYAAKGETAGLLCPMIDARRSEVFTALFDTQLNEVLSPRAMILDESSFQSFLKENKILFFGNGSKKYQAISKYSHAIFMELQVNATHLAFLSYRRYENKLFADLAYIEPEYLKDFHFKSR